MKMRSVILEPGSIICWKQYNILKRLWNLLLGRKTANNKFLLITRRTELLTIGSFLNIEVYEPIRKYNRYEVSKLQTIYEGYEHIYNWVEATGTINIVRPNTFPNMTTIEDSKYYKKVNLNEKLDKYIY